MNTKSAISKQSRVNGFNIYTQKKSEVNGNKNGVNIFLIE